MANLFFHGYKDFQRGKLCRTETLEQKIPINIEASGGSDFSLQENEICSIDLFGKDSELRIYPSEKDFRESEQEVTPYSLFRSGPWMRHRTADMWRRRLLSYFPAGSSR